MVRKITNKIRKNLGAILLAGSLALTGCNDFEDENTLEDELLEYEYGSQSDLLTLSEEDEELWKLRETNPFYYYNGVEEMNITPKAYMEKFGNNYTKVPIKTYSFSYGTTTCIFENRPENSIVILSITRKNDDYMYPYCEGIAMVPKDQK